MSADPDIYLDVETDDRWRLTVVGFHSTATGLVQLVGDDVSAVNLLAALPERGRLFTYNGHCFDLVCLQRQLGVNLRQRFTSIDLRWVCQRLGLTGGQKAVEQQLGRQRVLAGLSGRDAVRLWAQYQRGDVRALSTLLQYNGEDLHGLAVIHRHLAQRGVL